MGTGFTCYDKCSETTTTVAWKKSCSGNAAGTQFDMLKPGTYFLKYSCKDDAGLKTTACRTFVNLDKTKPVITILEAANANDGTWHVEASRDNNYVDAGATCSDMVDGNISQDVEVSGDVVNMAAVGTYKINYNCEDSRPDRCPGHPYRRRPGQDLPYLHHPRWLHATSHHRRGFLPVPTSSRTRPALPAPSPVAPRNKSSPSRLPSRTPRRRPPAPTPSMVPCPTLTSTAKSTLNRPAPTSSPTPSRTRTATVRTTPATLPPAQGLTTSPRPSLLRIP